MDGDYHVDVTPGGGPPDGRAALRRVGGAALRSRLALVAIGSLALGFAFAGCGDDGATTAPPPREPGGPGTTCDDEVVPSDTVPPAIQERLDAQGITGVTGEGAVWFVVPTSATWSAVVQDEGDGASAKVALWVDRDGPLPAVTVRRAGGGPERGSASSSPTADGLPGPVPTRLTFSGEGCWVVEAAAGGDTAHFRVMVG